MRRKLNTQDNDWFFDQFDRNTKRFFGWGIVGVLVFNIVFWGAIIFFVYLALNALGCC